MTSYLPVIDLLKGYFAIEARDDPRRLHEKVTGRLLSLDESLRPTLLAFLALLDLTVEDQAWQALDPPQRRQKTFDAIKRLLHRESQAQPLVLVFEDLHWIDSQTQALLDGLVNSLPTARMLLLVNYRPEYQHSWGSKTFYQQVRIDPLPAASAEEVLNDLLGTDTDATTTALRRRLVERTHGNPFFLEETVRALLEGGALVGERGAYRLVRPLEDTHVPATVQAVLAARIDRLPPEDKRLLQSAAVIGKDVPATLLEAIADLPEPDLRRALATLQAAEFLYETSLFPEHEYSFRHALTHDVAYDGLLQERRRLLHARIVEAIEQLHSDRLAEHVERLAHHAVRAEVWEKAVNYARRAGTKAFDRSANRDAVAAFEEALAALDHLPESRATLELAVDLRFQLRPALVTLGRMDRVLVTARDAAGVAERLGDPGRLAFATICLVISRYAAGQLDEALAAAERARGLAASVEDLRLQAVATQYIGLVQAARTDYAAAVESFARAIRLLPEKQARERFGMVMMPAVLSRAYMAHVLGDLGGFTDGLRHGAEALRLAETPADRLAGHAGLGAVYLRQGNLAHAISHLETGVAITDESNLPLYFRYLGPLLGVAYALEGRTRDGLAMVERARQQDITLGLMAHHANTLVALGEVHLLAGRPTEAAIAGQEALTLSRERREPGHEAYTHRLLGEVAATSDPPDAEAAGRHFWEGLSLAEHQGMRPLVAHCHFGLGKLYRRTSDRVKAQEHLTTAATMYREMGMSFWLEKVEAELGPSHENSP